MSEPVSAFAAYKGNAAMKTENGKKSTNAKKNSRKNKPKAKPTMEATKTTTNVTAKKKVVAPKQLSNGSTSVKVANKSLNGSKHAENGKPGKPKMSVQNKKQVAAKATKQDVSAANTSIKKHEVDKLVQELIEESPTNPKKLSKAQQKKKQELEAYLVSQLEADDEINGGQEEEDNDYSDSDSDGSTTSDSNENKGEYTLNDSVSSFEKHENEAPENQKTANERYKNQTADRANTSKTQKRKVSVSGVAVESPQENATKKDNTTATSSAKKSKKHEQTTSAASKKDTKTKIKTSSDTPKEARVSHVKIEPNSPTLNAAKMNSITEGLKVFGWLLNPINAKDFFAKYWEKNACLVKRQTPNYYTKLMSFEAIDKMLINNHVEFTKNIDLTSYKNGVRETLNPEGRAMPPVVWEHYGQGCSIRLLNPQTFLPELFTLNTTLQEYFHCLVGANAYLTPPNSQGFAPHYDDIEAFVLQVEGRKRWKLYNPRSHAEMLPRESSPNFTQAEIGKPILEQVLKPGDLLYFPRGTIHQACTEPGHHSLHITLSVYQKQSFADLLERMMPLILQRAITNSVDLRSGLPLHTWHHAGIAFSDNDTKERAELLQKGTKMLGQCLREVNFSEVFDAAVDQLAKKYQHEALPPEILPSERLRTVFGSSNRTNERGECVCDYDIELRSNVRLLRANIMRLVEEEGKIRIYYYLDNSKEYCEYEPNFIEIEPQEAASVEVLIRSYPEYIGVSQLPLEEDDQKIQVVSALWERGLLMMEKPFK